MHTLSPCLRRACPSTDEIAHSLHIHWSWHTQSHSVFRGVAPISSLLHVEHPCYSCSMWYTAITVVHSSTVPTALHSLYYYKGSRQYTCPFGVEYIRRVRSSSTSLRAVGLPLLVESEVLAVLALLYTYTPYTYLQHVSSLYIGSIPYVECVVQPLRACSTSTGPWYPGYSYP